MRTLMASVDNSILQGVRREQTELNLHRRNRMDRMRLADRSGADLAQTDSTDLAFLDKLRKSLNGGFDGNAGVDTREFEDVNGFDTIEDFDRVIDGRTDTFWASVGTVLHVKSTLDAEADFVGVFGVLLEVVLDEVEGVSIGGAVVDTLGRVSSDKRECEVGVSVCGRYRVSETYTVPKVGTLLQCRLHDLGSGGILDGGPWHGHAHQAEADLPDWFSVDGGHDQLVCPRGTCKMECIMM